MFRDSPGGDIKTRDGFIGDASCTHERKSIYPLARGALLVHHAFVKERRVILRPYTGIEILSLGGGLRSGRLEVRL